MITITLPAIVNATPPAFSKGVAVISLLSTPRMSAVLSGYMAVTLTSLPDALPLAPLSTR